MSPASTLDGHRLAYFVRRGDAYGRNPLLVEERGARSETELGFGDPFVRPVWSSNGRYLLYVRVEETRAFPSARWSLVQLDTATGKNRVLARHNALNLTPLGWLHGKPLYLIATGTETSLFTISAGHSSFVGIFMPQIVTWGLLSPDGRYIAFGVPASCSYCTLHLYDLAEGRATAVLTGMVNELSMMWTRNGSRLIAAVRDQLAVVSPDSRSVEYVSLPGGLPNLFYHPARAGISAESVELVDILTGRKYRSSRKIKTNGS
jgi:Tol biopolymer transport system component